jgi:O-acetyl-ADP-ribose deacetylase (regulator of RNase III)
MRLVLVDLHGSVADAAHKLGWAVDEVLPYTSVADVPRTPGTAFVSPANALGFMDGGIDYVLSRVMFPGVEQRVKAAFASSGGTTLLGRPYMPIGRAAVVSADADAGGESSGVRLVAAPTMWMPQDVRGTHNAYHAMYAALSAAAAAADPIHTLVTSGLCTGCGMMPAEQAVAQMRDAHVDFLAGRAPRYTAEQVAAEQPLLYENTEFKVIDPAAVVHS